MSKDKKKAAHREPQSLSKIINMEFTNLKDRKLEIKYVTNPPTHSHIKNRKTHLPNHKPVQ